jgi:hypothetical protein
MGLGGAERIVAGLNWNLAKHPPEQKKYSSPS